MSVTKLEITFLEDDSTGGCFVGVNEKYTGILSKRDAVWVMKRAIENKTTAFLHTKEEWTDMHNNLKIGFLNKDLRESI